MVIAIVFEKFRYKKVFPPHKNEKPAFESRPIEKFPFRDGVDGRPNLRNKTVFLNFSGER